MATIKSFTSLEQSKKLAEILPIESADSHYVRNTYDFMGNPVDGKWSHPKYGNPDSKFAHYVVQNFSNYEIIPCWSLASLLSVLPYCPDLSKHTDGKWYITTYPNDVHTCLMAYNDPIDACYEMILKLHEQNLL